MKCTALKILLNNEFQSKGNIVPWNDSMWWIT